MKLEIGTTFRTKDHLRQFRVTNIKIYPEPSWSFMLICLLETEERIEVEIPFDNLCKWFKQTEWEIVE